MWRYAKSLASTSLAAACLGGCAAYDIHSGGTGAYPPSNEVPIATNFETTRQHKLQAAEHWRRAATDAAAALTKSVRGGSTIHLRRACETTGCAPQACDTAFNRVFFNEFLTALVGLGHRVSLVPVANAPVLEIDVQAVGFAPNRPQYRYAGVPTEIGPGVWALRDVAGLVDAQGNVAPRTEGPVRNWWRAEFAGGRTPRNELVVTVSALSAERTYVARDTKIYYTADADASLYACGGEAAARVWTIPVSGDCTAPRCTQAPERRRP